MCPLSNTYYEKCTDLQRIFMYFLIARRFSSCQPVAANRTLLLLLFFIHFLYISFPFSTVSFRMKNLLMRVFLFRTFIYTVDTYTEIGYWCAHILHQNFNDHCIASNMTTAKYERHKFIYCTLPFIRATCISKMLFYNDFHRSVHQRNNVLSMHYFQ